MVIGYSVFARDVWQTDAGEATWPRDPNPPRTFDGSGVRKLFDGWGVQRLLDGLHLGSVGRVLPRHPVVREVRTLDDGATALIDCWVDPREGGEIRAPVLHLGPVGAEIPLRRVARNRSERRLTFQLRADEAHPVFEGKYRLSLSGDAETSNSRDANPELYLSLRASLGAGHDVREALTNLAWLSGGARVNTVSAPAALAYHEPVPWLVGLITAGLTIVSFLWFLRPWTSLWLTLDRWRLKARKAAMGDPSAGEYDVETVLNEWGNNPGLPRSSRRAGLPAGVRPYAGGDAITSARPSSLIGLTSLGPMVGLPPRRPIVRLRHVTQAMEATMLIDASPGLSVPDASEWLTKTTFIGHLAVFLAGTIWLRSGTVVVATLQDPEESWGPAGAGENSDELREFIANQIRSSAKSAQRAQNAEEGTQNGPEGFRG